MSATSSPDQELTGGIEQAGSRSAPPATAIAEVCPLCGSAIAADQDWCLHCGAAARTRVAATPRWQPPLLLLLVLAAICVAVLAAALVKLARGSGPAPAALTRTLPNVAAAPGAASSPGAATTPATTSTQGAGAAQGNTTSTGTTPGAAATTPTTATTAPTTPATPSGSGASPAR